MKFIGLNLSSLLVILDYHLLQQTYIAKKISNEIFVYNILDLHQADLSLFSDYSSSFLMNKRFNIQHREVLRKSLNNRVCYA